MGLEPNKVRVRMSSYRFDSNSRKMKYTRNGKEQILHLIIANRYSSFELQCLQKENANTTEFVPHLVRSRRRFIQTNFTICNQTYTWKPFLVAQTKQHIQSHRNRKSLICLHRQNPYHVSSKEREHAEHSIAPMEVSPHCEVVPMDSRATFTYLYAELRSAAVNFSHGEAAVSTPGASSFPQSPL